MTKKKSQQQRNKSLLLCSAALYAALGGLFLPFLAVRGAAAQQATVDYPIVKLRSLDKITARTMTFDAKVGSTIKFGNVYIKVRACRKTPEMETPEAASFIQVWEVPPGQDPAAEKADWIFSGWIFASSPGLSSMDHPVYDVWVLDCLGTEPPPAEEGEKAAPAESAEPQDESREGEGEVADEAVPDQPAMDDAPLQD